MTILFISRKYPPVKGGMENYAYNLHQQFIKNHAVIDIILNKSQKHLIWFFPWIFFYGTYLVFTKKIDLIYIGDGLLSPAAYWFQSVLRKKVLLTIYGLDVIYDRFGYQKIIGYFLPKINSIISISHATKEEALKRGVHAKRCLIIPVGINAFESNQQGYLQTREKLRDKYNIETTGKTILFSIGRLVKRKGVYWFIKNVIEELDESYVYLVAGDGDEKEKIEKLIKQKKLSKKVIMLGKVSDEEKSVFFSASDIFIMPNISIKNDMEGFGIVNLEAGLYGVPVVASNIEGIIDAVANGVTGYLVPEKSVTDYLIAIKNVQNMDKKQIQIYVENNFSWESIYRQYMEFIDFDKESSNI